jgi:bifunctional DNase/RNase
VAFKDHVKVFDSRSSDSIALAIHFKAPIIVGRDLLNSAGSLPEKPKTDTL